MFQPSTRIHFKCVCFSGSLIHRHTKTDDEDMRLPVSCCGRHRRTKKKLGLHVKHKGTVAILTQDQIIRPDPNPSFMVKSWKWERHFCCGSVCAILPFFPTFWKGCYQAGTPGGRFGQMPWALAGTGVFPLLKGIEIWRCHASCTHWMYFNRHLHVTKKKRNCSWCALQV